MVTLNNADVEYDFTQIINTPQLLDEISAAGLSAPDVINTDGPSIQIFYVAPLSADEQSTLSSVVVNHVANPNYIPVALQSEISTLIGYLNNSDMTIANMARSVMITNLAPKLPSGMINTINAQIATAIGA